jgi:hypothetical protein
MTNKWAGWILIVLGALFSLLGFTAAARELFASPAACLAMGPAVLPPGLLEAFGDILAALAAAPQWLALTVVGVFLIYAGTRVANDQPILPNMGG